MPDLAVISTLLIDSMDREFEPNIVLRDDGTPVLWFHSYFSVHMNNGQIEKLVAVLQNHVNWILIDRIAKAGWPDPSEAITQDAPTDYEPDVTPI